MANFKVLFGFTQPFYSWKEGYYRFGSTVGAAATVDSFFIGAMMAFRHPLTVLTSMTVSDVTNNRISILRTFNRPGTRVISGDNPDVANTAARVKLTSAAIGSSRSIWYRGLSDGDVKRDPATGRDAPSATLTNLISTFLFQLQDRGFENRRLTPINGTSSTKVPIASIIVDAAGGTTITVPGAFGLPASRGVVITRLDQKDWPGLKGFFTIPNVASVNYPINYKAHKAAATYLVPIGFMRSGGYDYGGINADLSAFSKFTSRKTGGSPLAGRGRRSTGVRRSA